jgi:hypothetical protein
VHYRPLRFSENGYKIKNNEMSDSDNPPIGLILCGSKSEALAKYATSGMDNQLFVSKYLFKLSDKKVFENFIERKLENKTLSKRVFLKGLT